MPTVFYPKIEANKLFPMKKMFVDLLTETGYLHLQATKPDTVGILKLSNFQFIFVYI